MRWCSLYHLNIDVWLASRSLCTPTLKCLSRWISVRTLDIKEKERAQSQSLCPIVNLHWFHIITFPGQNTDVIYCHLPLITPYSDLAVPERGVWTGLGILMKPAECPIPLWHTLTEIMTHKTTLSVWMDSCLYVCLCGKMFIKSTVCLCLFFI